LFKSGDILPLEIRQLFSPCSMRGRLPFSRMGLGWCSGKKRGPLRRSFSPSRARGYLSLPGNKNPLFFAAASPPPDAPETSSGRKRLGLRGRRCPSKQIGPPPERKEPFYASPSPAQSIFLGRPECFQRRFFFRASEGVHFRSAAESNNPLRSLVLFAWNLERTDPMSPWRRPSSPPQFFSPPTGPRLSPSP